MGQLPMTLVAVGAAGDPAGVVGLGPVDDELRAAERGGRAPWIVPLPLEPGVSGGTSAASPDP
jgi:hypothetical protein